MVYLSLLQMTTPSHPHIRTHTYTCTYTHTFYPHTQTYTYKHTRTYTHTFHPHTHTYAHKHTHIHTQTRTKIDHSTCKPCKTTCKQNDAAYASITLMLLKAKAKNLQLVHQSSSNVESVRKILDWEFAK